MKMQERYKFRFVTTYESKQMKMDIHLYNN